MQNNSEQARIACIIQVAYTIIHYGSLVPVSGRQVIFLDKDYRQQKARKNS
jgi:hypothetical protein